MECVDLFSGIGGISLALHGLTTPVLYCENDPHRQRVLETLFAKGCLPRARIHPDVRSLQLSQLSQRVDMVAGGWPCVGFSASGLGTGFADSQSGLFEEFVRVVKDTRPKVVFQENVPRVILPKPWRTTICGTWCCRASSSEAPSGGTGGFASASGRTSGA